MALPGAGRTAPEHNEFRGFARRVQAASRLATIQPNWSSTISVGLSRRRSSACRRACPWTRPGANCSATTRLPLLPGGRPGRSAGRHFVSSPPLKSRTQDSDHWKTPAVQTGFASSISARRWPSQNIYVTTPPVRHWRSYVRDPVTGLPSGRQTAGTKPDISQRGSQPVNHGNHRNRYQPHQYIKGNPTFTKSENR